MKKKYLAFLLTMVMAVCLIAANIPQVSAEGLPEGEQQEETNPKDEEKEKEETDDLNTLSLESTIAFVDAIKTVRDWDSVDENLKAGFDSAYASAKEVLAKAQNDPTSVTQAMIDDAEIDLWNAIWDIMLADGDDLIALIAEAEEIGKNESKYTADSYKVFKEALDAARAVVADENADYEDVLIAFDNLVNAMKGLKLAQDPSSVPSTPQSNNTSSGAPSPKTGDEFSAVILVALLASGVALVSFKKRNQH